MSGQGYTLKLVPVPRRDDRGVEVPPAKRLGRLLKLALRCYGFRCVEVWGDEVTPQATEAGQHDSEVAAATGGGTGDV